MMVLNIVSETRARVTKLAGIISVLLKLASGETRPLAVLILV